MFDDRLKAWAKDARVVLGRELRHTIEKISPDTTRTTGEQPALPAAAPAPTPSAAADAQDPPAPPTASADDSDDRNAGG